MRVVTLIPLTKQAKQLVKQHGALPNFDYFTIEDSLEKLHERHCKPAGVPVDVFWFGARNKTNHQRRIAALQHLRERIAAGDIHPNPPKVSHE